jgi:glucokinase
VHRGAREPPGFPIGLLRFKEAFASSPFRKRFERKGRFAGMLAKIPTRLILEESPALLGPAHLPLAG